jgi:DNA-binding NarL/FixJ family response regulator
MGTVHRGAFPETLTRRAITQWETSPITIVLVDDQVVFRNVARAMLERDGECDIVGEAADGYQAIKMVESCDPDVVVMDVQMAELGGLEATRRILETHPATNIVLISMGSDMEYPRLAREIGARGFLPKRNLNPESLRALLGIGPNGAPAAIAA